MQLAVGNIVEGKVTGITKFGAFVELPGGKTAHLGGLTHQIGACRAGGAGGTLRPLGAGRASRAVYLCTTLDFPLC